MRISRLTFIPVLGALISCLAGCEAYYDGGDEAFEEELGSADEALAVTFSPSSDSLNFNNKFKNDVVFDITTGGLCGGMVYTALDYFYDAAKAVPLQDFRPAVGSTLRSYLYSRQEDSIERNLDKWAELGFNPFGVRNDEFWRWGWQSNARVPELRKAIDAGKPTPLGLQACGGCAPGNHQVLALGYTLGAYNAALGGYPDLRIRIYDPSYPNETRTLRTDQNTRLWYDAKNTSRKWLTYFVDANYTRATPPSISTPASGLLLTITTGGDDLRGGSDNFNVKITKKDGTTQSFSNLNRSGRWIGDSTEQVAVSVADPANVKSVTISTTFGGGIGGDNWNVDQITVHNISASKTVGDARYSAKNTPLKRFTGDAKTLTISLN